MKKSFSYLTIALIVVIIPLLLLVFNAYGTFSSFRQDIAEKEEDLKYQEEYFKKLSEISDRLKENSGLLDKIDSGLPSNPEVPELLAFVQKAASQSALSLGTINLGALSSVEEKIKSTKVNFIVAGDYPGFLKFLSFIENSSRLIDIDTIHFTYPEEDEFRFNIKITAYSY